MCENLKTVEFGTGLKGIGMLAFNFCAKLETIAFPEGMESLGSCVFLGCNELGEVSIPGTVTMFDQVIANAATCPNMVIVTPAGSAAEAQAELDGIPVKNP